MGTQFKIKTIPAPFTRLSWPVNKKAAPGLATQGKSGLMALCWFLFGLQRGRLAQKWGHAVGELTNPNKTKKGFPFAGIAFVFVFRRACEFGK